MEVMKAILFGIILSLTVGPIAILVLNNGMHHGYMAAVRSAAGAALADYCYALVSFVTGSLLISKLDQYHYQIILLSSWVLIFMGFYMMFNAMKNTKLLARVHRPTKKLGFRSAFYLTLANPIAIIALSAFIGHSTEQVDLLFAMQLAGAVFVGSLIVQCLLAISGFALKDDDSITFPFYLQLLGGLLICLFGVNNFIELAG
ncbi:LysE family transporter [Photobacterium rosenbergii]|uniref:LysE family transporter n=1 Tax=Photobacterium rosenbergii TaxID=294936 RepID=A0ABU3ZGR0_9GAMM|nr:LysE family transporter [Photobacterium rosenbergii]MDV5169178.1 LysE family transporter [Photobacterium rosenbergii]